MPNYHCSHRSPLLTFLLRDGHLLYEHLVSEHPTALYRLLFTKSPKICNFRPNWNNQLGKRAIAPGKRDRKKNRRITSKQCTSRFRWLRNRWDCSVGLETPTRVFGNLALDQREAGWTLYLVASKNGGPDERAGMPPMRNRVRARLIIVSRTARRFTVRLLNYLREWMLLRAAASILGFWDF